MQYLFDYGLTSKGWLQDVIIEVDASGGRIVNISSAEDRSQHAVAKRIHGAAVPGFVNAHSHAFQRAFTGLSEFRTSTNDSFWSWRKLMYQFLESLTPDEMFHIARDLYDCMLKAGYTSVCEFHYVHNDPQGIPYSSLGEMSAALIRAAEEAGISICLIPVLYQRGGFQNQALEGGQKRFALSDEQFFELLNELQTISSSSKTVSIGMAFHSLRAVDPEKIQEISQQFSKLFPKGPIHIHIAEQLAEVEQCAELTGRRPVELLFDRCEVDARWCLIHATHLTTQERRQIANSGATICVCPTTEANLGDGIFDAEDYLLQDNGNLAIGSDSNIAIDPFAELRLLEYGQRLSKKRRAVLCDHQFSVGRYLCEYAWRGGKLARSVDSTKETPGLLAAGQPADIVGLNIPPEISKHVAEQPDRLLDYCLFNQTNLSNIKTVIKNGKVVETIETC